MDKQNDNSARDVDMETLREQIEGKLVALCPFVDDCKRQCTPADQTNCWGVHSSQIVNIIQLGLRDAGKVETALKDTAYMIRLLESWGKSTSKTIHWLQLL